MAYRTYVERSEQGNGIIVSEPKTIFVTGASGFIAKHIVLQLLEAGYNVRGSVRNQAKADEVRRAVASHLKDAANLDARLSFVELDLTSDDGWEQALDGIDALLHTASPFPMTQPKDENDLIRPAVDGTLRALKAAKTAGVKRVVLTSSIAAVCYRQASAVQAPFTEADWTDVDAIGVTPYSKSKTLAERAAWDFVAENPEIVLTTVNPGMVMGPALDKAFGTSLAVVERILKGKDPALPKLMFDIVDVRDVAKMHVKALDTIASEGERLIGSGGQMWFKDLADALHAAYPDRRITTREAPNWFLRFYGVFDPAVRSIIPLLGAELRCDSSKARDILGTEFISPANALKASADYLIDSGTVT